MPVSFTFDPRFDAAPTQHIYPDPGYKRSHQPKTLKADFGDGYGQRAADGLNNDPLTRQLTWTNLTTNEASYMDNFMIARNGVQSFFWQSSDDPTALAYVCEQWEADHVAFGVYTFTATFRQVFDI
jgi:phage-related protein